MLKFAGLGVVIFSVFGGFGLAGGSFAILIQPLELVIIAGAAIGAYMIANRGHVLGHTVGNLGKIFAPPKYNKDSYLELLSLLYTAFKLAKTKGMLALEQHVENPRDSTLFSRFPTFLNNQNAMVFLCDYLRLLTLGTDNPHEVEALIDEEIATFREEAMHVPHAVQGMADGLPALGIVAAVLGVIKTMAIIDQPPAVIGASIGGALVGTLLGVLLSYGFVGPMALAMKQDVDAEMKYLLCMKAGILAHMQGYAPAVSVEFARKALNSDVRPTFYEVESTVSALPPV
ncbi:flagellar motor stator protein MotA [Lacibacterium aquatile]|uniref:Flagellar motor stator protein MotA n=1 Tax=Lacibacterium aquatile TaxID=1168082 RepID=A0ABW5DNQ7_9PROT